MVVRGEQRRAVEYLVKLLETQAFKENTIDTSLDGLIKERSISLVNDPHAIVLGAALFRAFNHSEQEEKLFSVGKMSGVHARHRRVDVAFRLKSLMKILSTSLRAPESVQMSTKWPLAEKYLAKMFRRNDGTLVAMYGGVTHEIDGLEEPLGLAMTLTAKRGCCRRYLTRLS